MLFPTLRRRPFRLLSKPISGLPEAVFEGHRRRPAEQALGSVVAQDAAALFARLGLAVSFFAGRIDPVPEHAKQRIDIGLAGGADVEDIRGTIVGVVVSAAL